MNKERVLALERVERNGLTPGQIAILKALEEWFDEYPHAPKSMRDVARMAKVSQTLVGFALPVLEKLGYVLVHRDRFGRIRHRGIILMMALGEEEL